MDQDGKKRKVSLSLKDLGDGRDVTHLGDLHIVMQPGVTPTKREHEGVSPSGISCFLVSSSGSK